MLSSFRIANGRARRGVLAFVALVLIAAWATVASATVMIYADLTRLVELSDVIVQGRVVDQHTFFDEEADEIATITSFEVDHAYHGKVTKGDVVKFRQWGGEYQDRMAAIPGDAQFEPYEEAIVFLVDGKGEFAGMRYLVALGQSKYTVVRNGGNAVVVRALDDLAFLDKETNRIEARHAERRDLESFRAELQTLVAGIKGGAQ